MLYMNRTSTQGQRAFTLIELLVVLVILDLVGVTNIFPFIH